MKRKDSTEPGKRIVTRAEVVPTRPRKSTQDRAREIQLEVMGMLADLTDRECIVQHCARKYGLHSRQADTYIARARAMLREGVAGEVQDQRAAAVHRLSMFLEKVQQSGRDQLALELQVHREINKLLIPAQWEAVERMAEIYPGEIDLKSRPVWI